MTIISLMLGWLALAGFLCSGVIFTNGFPELPFLFGFLALAYGLTAALACVGLWKMEIWGLKALRSWLCVLILFFVSFSYVFYDYALGVYLALSDSLSFSVFYLGGFILMFVQNSAPSHNKSFKFVPGLRPSTGHKTAAQFYAA